MIGPQKETKAGFVRLFKADWRFAKVQSVIRRWGASRRPRSRTIDQRRSSPHGWLQICVGVAWVFFVVVLNS